MKGSMTLRQWLDGQGEGAMTRLVRDSGLTWPAVAAVVKGTSMPGLDTAAALEKATGGAVTMASILTECEAKRAERENRADPKLAP